MSEETITVRIGGRDFTIHKMKIRQLKFFSPPFLKFDGLLTTQERWDSMIDALLAAFCVDYPQITRQEIEEMSSDATELLAAANALAYFSGLFKKKEPGAEGDQPGEAKGTADSTLA